MKSHSNPAAGRTLGIIFFVIGIFLFGLALWQRFGAGEDSKLFAPAALMSGAATIMILQSRRSSDDAR